MRTPRKVVIGVVVVAVVLAGVGIWWFFEDDAPEEVSLESARDSVTSTTAGDVDSSEIEGLDGVWTVDSTSGEFDFESATGTFAGFRIQEELAGIGQTTAVGRTGGVTGEMTIDGTTVTDATFEVDMTTITTNESRRDDRVQQALETEQFPTATFTLTEPIDLGDGADSGDPVQVTAVGDLTIHGVTKAIELPIEAQLVDGTIVVVGSTDVVFSDYGVEVPQAQIVLSVEDHGVLELQLLLVKQ
ncbi:MAG TPA: YceI family protein [Acidimicrobiales bacterium]|nr:YceI family protein [Acidimicrobiales bacterium]